MVATRLLTSVRVVLLESGDIAEGWLRVVEGRIAGFGAGEAAAGDALVEDLGGAYVLPGLWDAHAHLSFETPVPAHEGVVQRTLRCAGGALRGLRAGVTGFRGAGDADYIDCALKEFFARGTVAGPRIVPAGYALTTTGGHETTNPAVRVVDGPDEYRRAVRDNIRRGAEHIKVIMSGGIWGPAWDDIFSVFHAGDELRAIFDTATARGFPVMAHTGSAGPAKLAVRHGARSLEHGYALDEEVLSLMKEAGTYFVPTLSMSQLSAALAFDEYEKAYLEDGTDPITPQIREKALGIAERAKWGFQQAHRMGIPIACGSDMNRMAEGAKLELAWMVRFGMTPREALIAATKTAAELAGYGGVTGSLESGKEADLLAVEGNPLEDIYAVRRVRGVWRAGVRVA